MRIALRTRAHPGRIIIADDESLIRLDLREMLTHLGYDVIAEAGDGRTALDLARKLRPDLVIMDIKMPDVDGITAAEELTRERIAPVVLLTAYSDQALVERAKEAGVVGYVVKPFREAELMPVIELCWPGSTSSARWSRSRRPRRGARRPQGRRARQGRPDGSPRPARSRSVPPHPQDQHGRPQVDEGSRRSDLAYP